MKLSSIIFQLSALRSSFLREWHRMTSRRIYLGAAVVLPLLLLLFMATIFGTGQMVQLPVGVVDADNSATSRRIVRDIAATPTLDVVCHYADEAEARAAVRSFGLNPDTNAHFLNLPFYETGGISKGSVTDADIDIVVKLLRDVQPHQIYAAGDLSDPHGTHRTCIEVILAALEVVRDDEWLKDCHLWLYRGAWMEWDLGSVDMAVPLSPDELIMKRHAIYRHLSQKDIVPFPGDDPREFWQRAEERTQNTAKQYDALGMAEYQAIEVFVKMF